MTAQTEPRYRIVHVGEWEPATWDTARADGHPALYNVRYYNPANECENFPFGHVNQTTAAQMQRDYLADLADLDTFTMSQAGSKLAELAHFGPLMLEPVR